VDIAAPGAPTGLALASGSDSGSSTSDRITNVAAPTVTGTAEASSVVTLYDGTTVLGTGTADGSGVWSITSSSLSDGAHTLTAQAVDVAGNSSTASAGLAITIDLTSATPGGLALVSGSDSGASDSDRTTKVTTPTASGTAEANSAVTLYDGVTAVGTVTADAAGLWSITSPSLSDGAHTLTAQAVDVAGNTSTASTALTVTVDATAPTAPLNLTLDPASDSDTLLDNITTVRTPQITGTAEQDTVLSLFDGSNLLGTTTVGSSGTWAITSSELGVGPHTLTARAVDLAGNTSTASGDLVITIGNPLQGAPSSPLLDSGSDSGALGDRLTNVATPTLTGTAEAGSTVSIYDSGTLVGSAVADTLGGWSVTTTTLSNSVHSLYATAVLGGTLTLGSSSSLTITIDASVPDTPSTPTLAAASDSGVAGDGITRVTTPTLSGTAQANGVVTLYDGSTAVGTVTADAAGLWSVVTGTLPDGAHTLTARTTNAAGSTSVASSALVLTIDTTATTPSVPALATASDSGSSGSDRITNVVTPTLTGTAEAGSTVLLYDGGDLIGQATADGAGAWTVTASARGDGTHTLTAQAIDVAGNTSSVSTGLAITIDVTAPNAPDGLALASGSDSGSSDSDRLTNVVAPTVTGTAEASSVVTLYDGTTVLGTGTAAGSGVWSITSSTLGSGGHTLTATAVDVAGNSSTASTGLAITIDTTAPNAPDGLALASGSDSGSSGSDRITNVTAPTITGTAEANSVVTLYDGTTVLGTGTASSRGVWSITSATLGSGEHTLTAAAVDVAGNSSTASSGLTVTIDSTSTTPDGLALASGSDSGSNSSDGITNVTAPTITGTAEANAVVTLYDGATAVGTGTADGGGAWSITSSALGSGGHTLTATAVDVAGNCSTASSGLTVTIDSTVAAPTGLALASGSDSGSSGSDRLTNVVAPTITGTAEASSVVTLYDGATAVGTGTADGSGVWSIASSTLGSGGHTLSATAVDVAGNTSTASTALTVTIDSTITAPTGLALASGSDSGSSGSDRITNMVVPTITGTAEASSVVTLYDGTTVLGTGTANGSGVWSVTSATLGEGGHTLTAAAVDVAGNSSTASTGLAITIDTTVAAPTGLALASGSDSGSSTSDRITNVTAPTVTGTAEASSVVTLYDGTTVLGTGTADGSGVWSITSSTLGSGGH
ncbi:Ig-like domain-containing protein, partial [Azospirillum sp. TSO35-2]|uniref:beta strand repeat-containing protein n=1 Tax=Azospirillum sp. TSO35-2 TaxID=716796 RepID=UPI001FFFB097